MKPPICDLTKTECKFAGLKSFNYGFMRGTEDFCRHPNVNHAVYKFDGSPAFACPTDFRELDAIYQRGPTNDDHERLNWIRANSTGIIRDRAGALLVQLAGVAK